jgi:hypothetical protein
MTFGAIRRRLEASCVKVTFGAIYLHVDSPPFDPALPQP